jgi:hypothetical protein
MGAGSGLSSRGVDPARGVPPTWWCTFASQAVGVPAEMLSSLSRYFACAQIGGTSP